MKTLESIGLGEAPHKCVGVYTIPSLTTSVEMHNHCIESRPEGFNAGSCACCNRAIVHSYLVVSSDNVKMSLGSSCIDKIDSEMTDAKNSSERNLKARQRKIKKMQDWAKKLNKYIEVLNTPMSEWNSKDKFVTCCGDKMFFQNYVINPLDVMGRYEELCINAENFKNSCVDKVEFLNSKINSYLGVAYK